MLEALLASPVPGVIGPVIAVVLVGVIYAHFRPAQMTFVNTANMDLFVPALIFSALTTQPWSFDAYLPLMILAALVVLLPGLLTLPLLPWLKMPPRVLLPPVMFNNSGNLGIPLLVFAFGDAALPAAVLLFIVENTLHFTLGMAIVSGWRGSLRFLRSPMIWATLAAVVVHEMHWTVPLPLARSIDLLGQIAIPLMLFALGVRIREARIGSFKLAFLAGLWIPVTGIASLWLGLQAMQLWGGWTVSAGHADMLWLFALLPPAVLNFLVAERYLQQDLHKHQVAELVLVGNLLCIIPLSLALALLL